ncbi:hypothetical protein FRB96_003323 [Tulasnella sp. 330]|nr:hypothetical protein FRB96_003323 [Tulasnella sp. 330]KAG8880821.1 hypothetical protein FRB97_000412 [Tulasnella sp. 331]
MLITGFQTQRLHEIHNRGVLHRDIKPISICGGLMQEQTIFYLIDFGLDKAYRPRGVHIARRKDLSPLGHPPGPALRSIDPIPKVVAATSSHQPMRPSTFGKGVFPGVSWMLATLVTASLSSLSEVISNVPDVVLGTDLVVSVVHDANKVALAAPESLVALVDAPVRDAFVINNTNASFLTATEQSAITTDAGSVTTLKEEDL